MSLLTTTAIVVLALSTAADPQALQAQSAKGPGELTPQSVATKAGPLKFESVTRKEKGPKATIQLLYRTETVEKHPAILMLGSLDPNRVPDWSPALLSEGYMLVAFMVEHPQDPDPARRPQWLHFDERFANAYVMGGYRAPTDAGRVIDYLATRGDVNAEKIGWMGASSTGIPGLAVATREPRLSAIVVFVSTGAYRKWLETWHTNGLWKGKTDKLWSETEEFLKYDPILHVQNMFPTAVLMVNGGDDKVVDVESTRMFMQAAAPYYKRDPNRLRLVVYEGMGHNLPRDVVKMYTEHWFHLYLHPTNPPPEPQPRAANLSDEVKRTQINNANHRTVVGAEKN